jgi:hypothetical protein
MDDETNELRVFTLREARALIPRLRKLLSRIMQKRSALADLRAEIDLARENADKNGGSYLGPAYLEQLIVFSEAVQTVQAMGIHVKDFRNGLVDFPYEREGRIVYLCWKPDEDQIEWWHEVDAGFTGRQPINEEFD